MSLERNPVPSKRPSRIFVPWCWAMLLVVLVSAAPTDAQARSRLVGSAFDPASVSVALGPKETKAKGLAVSGVRGSGLPDLSGGGPPALAIVEGVVDRATADLVRGAQASTLAPRPPVYWGLSPNANGARAPPAE